MNKLTQLQEQHQRELSRKLSPCAKMFPRKQSPLVEKTLQDIMKVYKVSRKEAQAILTKPM